MSHLLSVPCRHVKLSVPLVELTGRAVQLSQNLAEGVEVGGGPADSDSSPLTADSLNIHTAYSNWQAVQLLFTNLPLLRLLFSLLFNSFKKAQTLATAHHGSSAHPSASQRESSAPIKTRTEKEDRMAKLIELSWSEKISEKIAAGGKEGENEEEGSERTPSPVSTISSSGEVEGAYTLYTSDGSQTSDVSGECHVIYM